MTDWSLAIKIEHEVQRIITQQEINGFYFDTEKAIQYIQQLEEETEELYNGIRPILVPEVEHSRAEVSKPFTKSGRPSARANTYLGNSVASMAGPFTPVEFVEPDIGKRARIIKQLERLGWRPTSYTEKGNPKLDEESLMKLEMPEGKMIARWYILKHRQSQINGWVHGTAKNPGVREDHRLTAYANPCGTNTGRMRHKQVVNVPKATDSVIFGKEMRSLFTVPEGYKLVGHDAAGLELRMLAHYLNDPEFTEVLLHGDMHTYNQELAGLPTRDAAKTFIYAFNYGAGDKKLGSIVGGSARDGAELRKRFLTRNKSLGRLVKGVQQASKKGYLIGLDGRRLYIRSEHSALNTLLQGGGAVVMKVSMVYLDKWLRKEGFTLEDVKKVGDFHDEAQAEVVDDKEIIELYSNLAVKSIIEAGTFLNLKCPLDADVKVGQSWDQTH